ncbi:MAG: GNAT family N-acetyltransferase [Acidobacteria bacterium]|nr:GNAT family N-acetyltransferase [Acidobacteriota bacterium]
MSLFLIREAVPADAPEIVALIRELAVYEKEPEAAVATEEDILRDGFGKEPYFRCLMVEIGAEIAGFALYFFQYSTWEGRPALYLEDLFVRERFRKQGIGRALFRRLAQVALEKNCTRFQWECLDWNQPGLDFYEANGAKILRDWLNLRVTGDALRALAEQSGDNE